MPTKAQTKKDNIAKAVFLARRRWTDELFRLGVYNISSGTLTIPRHQADRLKQELREEFDAQPVKKVEELLTDAERVIDAIDKE
jgi:hypothetical protein